MRPQLPGPSIHLLMALLAAARLRLEDYVAWHIWLLSSGEVWEPEPPQIIH